jgi:hypothetical protein
LDYLREVEKWDLNSPKSFRRNEYENVKLFSDDEFSAFKKNIIKQLKRSLAYLRQRELFRSGKEPVSNLTLEYKFDRIAKLVNRKADFPRVASYLSAHFNRNEMCIIYGLLDDIEEYAHEHVVSWGDAFCAWTDARIAKFRARALP